MAIIRVTDDGGLPCVGWEVIVKDDSSQTGLAQYSSKEYAWDDVPHGVLIAIWWHELHMPGVRKKTLSSGKDYFVYIDENNWGDTNNFEEVKQHKYKRGVWVTDKQMEAVYRTAFEKLDMNG